MSEARSFSLNSFKAPRTVQELQSVVTKQETAAAQQQKQIEALTAGGESERPANFVVEGEKHYWLHIAIDRFDGTIVDQQLEAVTEQPIADLPAFRTWWIGFRLGRRSSAKAAKTMS